MSDTAQPAELIGNTFSWHEVVTASGSAAKDFYCELLGWTTSEMPMGEGMIYTMFHPGEGQPPIAGLMEMQGPEWEGVPSHWMTYITVDDIEASAAKVTELGGEVMVPPTEIPNVGHFCVLTDPTGAVVSLFQGGDQECADAGDE